MPKEVIYDQHYGHDDDAVANGSAFMVEVSWFRDGLVQVAALKAGDWDETPESPRPGFYVTLDRAGCNRAIRTLRKARDQAYGADA